jgi:hypothetical protein
MNLENIEAFSCQLHIGETLYCSGASKSGEIACGEKLFLLCILLKEWMCIAQVCAFTQCSQCTAAAPFHTRPG